MTDEKVINNPDAPRARVDCIQSSSQSRFINKPVFSSQSTYAREAEAGIRCPEAYFRAWRIAKFGGDFDPIAVAVEEAVATFSSRKDEAGRESDRKLWLKIGNRIGLSRFLDAYDEKAGQIRDMAKRGKHLFNPASSFQKLLDKRYPKPEDPPTQTLQRGKEVAE